MIDQFIAQISKYPEIRIVKTRKGFISGLIEGGKKKVKYSLSWSNEAVYLRLFTDDKVLRTFLARWINLPCVKVIHKGWFSKTFIFAWHYNAVERKKFKRVVDSAIANNTGITSRHFGYQEATTMVA